MNSMKGLGIIMALLSTVLAAILFLASCSEKVKYPLSSFYLIAAAACLLGAFIILLLVTILIHLGKPKTDDKTNG